MDPNPTAAIIGLLDDMCSTVKRELERLAVEFPRMPEKMRVATAATVLNQRGFCTMTKAVDFSVDAAPYDVLPVNKYPDIYNHHFDTTEATAIYFDTSKLVAEESRLTEEAFADWEINGVKALTFAERPATTKDMRALAAAISWKRVMYTKKSSGEIHIKPVGTFYRLTVGEITGLVCKERLAMFYEVALRRWQIVLCNLLGVTTSDHRVLARKIARWQDKTLRLLGNYGFEIGKGIETVGRCLISERTGGGVPVGGLSDALEKYRTKCAKAEELAGSGETGLIESLEALLDKVETVEEAVEFFGLMNNFGHPTIDVRRGGRAQQDGRDKTKRTDEIDTALIEELRQLLQLSVVQRIIERSAVWPPFNKPPRHGTRLHSLWERRVTTLNFDTIPLSDFEGVQVGKIAEFPIPEVWTDLLDDKAIADERKRIDNYWFGRDPSQRRVLTNVLSLETFSPAELIEKVKNRTFREDELATGLVPKQGEHKVKGRFFSVEPLGPRTAMKMLEAGAGEIMSLVFPESTMVMTRAEQDRTAQAAFYVRDDEVFGELDASDWNINWEIANTKPFMEDLDALVGEKNLFTFQHWYFVRSLVHVRVAGYKVRRNAEGLFDDHDLCWGPGTTNPLYNDAGHEGKQQKPWTIITGLMGKLLNRRLPFLAISVVVQGDNITIKVARRDKKRVSDADLREAIDEATTIFAGIRQRLKPEESVFSRTVATYSKAIWIKGVEHASVMKWAASTKSTAVGSPWNLSTSATALGASCVANSAKSAHPHRFVAFGWACLRIEILSLRKASPSFARAFSAPDFRMLIRLPSPLGGRAVATVAQSIVRGAADPTSNEIALIRRMARVSPDHNAILTAFLDREYLWSKKPDCSRLIADPYSLCLDVRLSTRGAIDECVTPSVEALTVNADIRELLALQSDSRPLRAHLANGRPMYAELFRGIADCSGAGIADRAIHSFARSSTFVRSDFADMRIPEQVRSIEEEGDRSMSEWSSKLQKERATRTDLPPSFLILRSFRGRWGLGPNAFTGIESVSPLDAQLATNSLTDSIGAACLGDLEASVVSRGPFPVYFGKSTREKRVETGMIADEKGSVVNAVKRLVLISSQLDPGPNLRSLISDLIKSVCGLDLAEVESMLPRVVGGTAAHRYDSDRKSSFYINHLPGPDSHFLISSNHATVLKTDIPVAVQEFYITATHILGLAARNGASGPGACFLVIPTEGVEPVVTASPEIPPYPKSIIPSVNRENPLVGLKSLTFRNILDDAPIQWVGHKETSLHAGSILRSLLIPTVLSSVEGKRALEAPDSSLRSVELDVAEFLAIPFRVVIEEFGRMCAVAAVYWTVLRTVERGVISANELCDAYVLAMATSSAAAIAEYVGFEDATLADLRARFGLAVLPGKDRGARRNASIAALIYREATDLLASSGNFFMPLGIPADVKGSVVCARAWSFCILYSSIKPTDRTVKWGLLQALAFGIFKHERDQTEEAKSSRIVAATSQWLSENAPSAVIARVPIIYRSKYSRPEMRRHLRSLTTLHIPSIHQRIYKDGTAFWVEPKGETSLPRVGEVVDLGEGKIRRLLERPSVGLGSLESTFVPVVEDLAKGATTMISVGSGSGNWTTAGLEVGLDVSEVELLSALPQVPQDFANLTSAAGQTYRLRPGQRVYRHPATFRGGNILSATVQAMIACEPEALVVIDVQTFPTMFDYVSLARFVKTLPRFAWRVLCSPSEVRWCAVETGGTIATISYDASVDIQDAVIGKIAGNSATYKPIIPAIPRNPRLEFAGFVSRCLRSTEAKAIYATLDPTDLMRLVRKIKKVDESRITQALGKADPTFRDRRYDQYYSVLVAILIVTDSTLEMADMLARARRNEPLALKNRSITAANEADARQACEAAARTYSLWRYI